MVCGCEKTNGLCSKGLQVEEHRGEGTGVKETGRGGANSVSLVTRHLESLEKRGRQLGHSTGHRRGCDHGQKTGT